MKNVLFLTISLCFFAGMFASESFESKNDTVSNDNIQSYKDSVPKLHVEFQPVLDALKSNRTYHLTQGFKTLAEDVQQAKANLAFESQEAANEWKIKLVAKLDKLVSKRVKKYAKNKAKRANIKRRKILQSCFKH